MKLIKYKASAAVSVILITLSTSILLYAYSTGITGRTHKNGDGCTCHNVSPSSNVTVTISGPDSLTAGQTGTYSVTITGGPLARAGTDIAASSGTLAPQGSDLRLDQSDGELTHVAPKAPSGSAVTFTFLYTAPTSTGTITLYANGNSVNFNGVNDAGDMWNFAPNKSVVVSSVSGIARNNPISSYTLYQNYPNPFNPSTRISFSAPISGNVMLEIFNAIGVKVKTLVNEYKYAGNYSYNFNSSNFSSGVYYYKLTSGSFSETKKMIILK
ncbi:MAG: T9SS type A sorting domain-containing protein [Ignavibacteriaceae bacterium]|nr:T9SS type A sorting domain-containing protein [Ignavibacteriaceae bacterium]